MKFLLISKEGEGLFISYRLQKEGHDIKTWIKAKHAQSLYDGLLDKVEDYKTTLEADRIIIFDQVGGGNIAEQLKKDYVVIGGSQFADSLELNYKFARKILKQHGIKYSKDLGHDNIILISSWFNGNDFILPPIQSYIYRKELAGGLGSMTNCQGIQQTALDFDSDIFLEGIGKLSPLLKSLNYKGAIGLKYQFEEDALMPFEFVSHWHYDTMQGILASLDCNLGEIFGDFEHSGVLPLTESVFSIRVTIPPYPYLLTKRDININGFEANTSVKFPKSLAKSLFFKDIKVMDNNLVSAGDGGHICTLVGTENLRQKIDTLKIRDKKYRIDIAEGIDYGL